MFPEFYTPRSLYYFLTVFIGNGALCSHIALDASTSQQLLHRHVDLSTALVANALSSMLLVIDQILNVEALQIL